jgi:hypothetical protein
MLPGKERVGETVYNLELKSPLALLKLAVKVIMTYSCYKDNIGVVTAVTCSLMVIMLK